ncbi:ras-related and estrogen-regulated growth inhibitor-like [Physella acuta]|uniref:ras-related and estrogen-regulated growth inhibitor-like n=1 Tax=Physella acuta TaxID=109671 RepID=UPI0027DDA459|nr:ras-related and estrogen-regulated growth inhibitor-like [Physella acuta]
MNGTKLMRSPQALDNKENVCKVVVLGTPGVGKTALTVRFITKRFIGEYSPTLESVYRYMSGPAEDDDIRMDILDTAGQITSNWNEGYALWGDCFVLVYSITEHTSFDDVIRLRRQLESTRRSAGLVCALVGNKADLVYDRQVTAVQGQELANEMGCRFYEVSACDWNQLPQVSEIFTDLYNVWRRTKTFRDVRQRKSSSSTKFRQAIQKVISGKSPSGKKTANNTGVG